MLSSVLLLLFLHCRSNLSHYTTQKTTAFIAPSAAVFYSIYLFNSRHISSLYGIPIILSGEIEGFPCDFKEKTTPYQDLVSLENTETIVRAFVIDDDQLLPLGFHPYQNIQKSIDFAAKKNIHVITFNSPTIPSTLGCASYLFSLYFTQIGCFSRECDFRRNTLRDCISILGSTTTLHRIQPTAFSLFTTGHSE